MVQIPEIRNPGNHEFDFSWLPGFLINVFLA
jgi:hypothetical protein